MAYIIYLIMMFYSSMQAHYDVPQTTTTTIFLTPDPGGDPDGTYIPS